MEKTITFLINFIDRYYHQKKIYNFLKNFKIKIIFDVGAHKGEFLKLIKKIENFEKIYSFEPQKKIFQNLNLLSVENKIFCFNLALSNNNGIRNLKINEISSTSTFSEINDQSLWYKIKSFIVRSSLKSFFNYEEKVNVMKLDDFCNNHKISNIDLLKIDTKGHEKEVLQGALNLIKEKKIKYILLEFNLHKMYKNYSIKDLESFLDNSNFRLLKKYKFPFLFFEDRIYALDSVN
jgi:FkbM family methyltransferase